MCNPPPGTQRHSTVRGKNRPGAPAWGPMGNQVQQISRGWVERGEVCCTCHHWQPKPAVPTPQKAQRAALGRDPEEPDRVRGISMIWGNPLITKAVCQLPLIPPLPNPPPSIVPPRPHPQLGINHHKVTLDVGVSKPTSPQPPHKKSGNGRPHPPPKTGPTARYQPAAGLRCHPVFVCLLQKKKNNELQSAWKYCAPLVVRNPLALCVCECV